jgi:UDP-N-acetylmuramoylalanine-D-glutamate ligase
LSIFCIRPKGGLSLCSNGIIFSGLNPTQDHLDYHQDLKTYQQTKARLFSLASVQFAILNRDDTHYADFLVVAKGKCCKVTKKPCSVGRISSKSSKPKSIISLPLATTKKSA